MGKRRFPMSLPVLPTTGHTGKLVVRGQHANGWLVDYDLRAPSGTYIMDRSVVTSRQLLEWTGVDPAEDDDA